MVINVITGAPCSGKSTHIQMHATPGDIIIDLDRIALALTTDDTDHHQYPAHVRHVARTARGAAIAAAIAVEQSTGCRVWVIDTFPDTRRWKSVGAQIVTINPGYQTCLLRARDQRPEWVQRIIAEWFGRYGEDDV